jgi:hypothetical protein
MLNHLHWVGLKALEWWYTVISLGCVVGDGVDEVQVITRCASENGVATGRFCDRSSVVALQRGVWSWGLRSIGRCDCRWQCVTNRSPPNARYEKRCD